MTSRLGDRKTANLFYSVSVRSTLPFSPFLWTVRICLPIPASTGVQNYICLGPHVIARLNAVERADIRQLLAISNRIVCASCAASSHNLAHRLYMRLDLGASENIFKSTQYSHEVSITNGHLP